MGLCRMVCLYTRQHIIPASALDQWYSRVVAFLYVQIIIYSITLSHAVI